MATIPNMFTSTPKCCMRTLLLCVNKAPAFLLPAAFFPLSAVPQQDPEYMEQHFPPNYYKHLQEDTERAISRAVAAAAEQTERSPEVLLNAVCKTCRHTAHYTNGTTHVTESKAEISKE